MISTNKMIMIDADDYEYMKAELERLRAENKRLQEAYQEAKSEAFQIERELRHYGY